MLKNSSCYAYIFFTETHEKNEYSMTNCFVEMSRNETEFKYVFKEGNITLTEAIS